MLLRNSFGVEQATGFRRIAIEKIKKGLLKGNLDQDICKYIPDFEKMVVGEMNPEDVTAEYMKLAQYQASVSHGWSLWVILVICLLSFLVGTIARKIKLRK